MRYAAIGLVLAILAGGFAAWAGGAFLPCATADRLLGLSGCRVVARLDNSHLEAMVPDGPRLLAVVSARGDAPPASQRFVLIDPVAASFEEAGAIPAVTPLAAWMAAALSLDGELVAAGLLDQPTLVIDRATGEARASIPLFSAAHLAFDANDGLLVDRGEADATPVSDRTVRRFALADGAELQPARAVDAIRLFTSGAGLATSPDGLTLARRAAGEPGTVAIDLVSVADPGAPVRRLTGPLAAGPVDPDPLPRLWFSPDGTYLAASFDAAARPFSDTSSLFVWRVADGALVLRAPTRQGGFGHLVWLDDAPSVAVARYDAARLRSEVLVLSRAGRE